MYSKYFKIKQEPFSTTPDPRFLYRSAMHQEALERLIAAVTMRRGINAIIAEPGLGKSTLIRTMLSGLQETVNFAWVFNTTMEATDLLKFICRDFGFTPKSEHKSELLLELYSFFIQEHEQGRIPLLIIDEAQNLSVEALEEIRQLSNLETVNRKLVQIILSGQPQLNATLQQPDLVQLNQRISLKATLGRFELQDTIDYIRFRLAVVGVQESELFTDGAYKAIQDISGGIPRLINQICDNGILSASKQKRKKIDAVMIHDLLEKGAVMRAPAPPVIKPVEPEPKTKPVARAQKSERPKPVTKQSLRTRVINDKSDLFEAIDISELITVI